MSNEMHISEMLPRCPDCGVQAGQRHRRNCRMEQCGYCGGHLWQCLESPHGCPALKNEPDHPFPPPEDDRLPWEGIHFGIEDCTRYGLYSKPTPAGPVPCQFQDRGAIPDIGRLHNEAIWDRLDKKFILKKTIAPGHFPAPLCPECGVLPRELHVPGCVVEECPGCERKLAQCLKRPEGCPDQEELDQSWPPEEEDRVPWFSERFIEELCLGQNLYCRQEGGRLVPSDANDEEAHLDIRRFFETYHWDRNSKQFVLIKRYKKRKRKKWRS